MVKKAERKRRRWTGSFTDLRLLADAVRHNCPNHGWSRHCECSGHTMLNEQDALDRLGFAAHLRARLVLNETRVQAGRTVRDGID